MFFTNSGAEALECAIKMARKYHASKGHPERFRIITFEGAFHGRTLATLAAGAAMAQAMVLVTSPTTRHRSLLRSSSSFS